jgi:hypothetical protein
MAAVLRDRKGKNAADGIYATMVHNVRSILGNTEEAAKGHS